MATVLEVPSEVESGSTTSPESSARSAPAIVAAIGSAGAGLVHAAAAGTHDGDNTLVVLFAVVAAVQFGVGAALGARLDRKAIGAVVVANLVFVAAWVVSRTIGLPIPESLSEVEPVGWQDAIGAALGAIAVVAAIVAWMKPFALPAQWTARAAVAAAVVLLGAATTAVAAGASHGPSHDHGHGGGERVAAGAGDDTDGGAAHGHDEAKKGAAGAGAGATASVSPVPDTGDHAHAPVPERLNHPPSEQQKAAARALLDTTKRELAKYADPKAAEAAGFRSIGDSFTGVEHYVHADFLANVTILAPTEPESLVYRVHPDGRRELITAMYILPQGWTMNDVPDIAGNVTTWHDHQNLCWDPADLSRLAGVLVNGKCRPAGVFRPTPPMLHVWVVPNECGPFAGTDQAQMTGSCVHDF